MWLASFQESYLIYDFNRKNCIETYHESKGKLSISKYNYKFQRDTLYLYNFNSDSIFQKHFVVLKKNSIMKFNNTIYQRYYKFKKTRPILNKPIF